MATQRILVEICCGSLEDALEAERGGADRVELCSALFLGGLTPSLGTIMEAKARLKIPIMVMIRPRGGGFCYTKSEMAVMERDTVLAAEQGAEGMVFGILNADGSIDEERCKRLRKLIGDRQAVFHRAFDVTPDPFRSLDQLVALGFTRVLTSGQEDTVPEGAQLIKRLIGYAGDRIEILPGGGITTQPPPSRGVHGLQTGPSHGLQDSIGYLRSGPALCDFWRRSLPAGGPIPSGGPKPRRTGCPHVERIS